MPGTRQTERSRQTDMKVAHSAANAVRRDGFDQMALTRVASDAGYSSGVIYARCDDRSELMVLAWQKSFWPELREVLDEALHGVETRDIALIDSAMAKWAQRTSPTAVPDIGSAVEVIVAARRDEVLGEVVHNDILELMREHDAGPGTTGARRELVVFTVATLVGTALLNSAIPPDSDLRIDPTVLLHLMARRTDHSAPAVADAGRENTGIEKPLTGDDVRDALIEATEYVIARSGVHRATVSRIARRAGVSVGAIYGLYENKESLILDCISVIHPPQAERELASWKLVDAAGFRDRMSTNLHAIMSPDRALWRAFRIECLVAARHLPVMSQMFEEFSSDSIDTLNDIMNVELLSKVPARGAVVGLGVLDTVDPTLRDLAWEWFPIG